MTMTTLSNQPSTLQASSNGHTVETFQPSPNTYWDMALNRVYGFAKNQLQLKDADDATLRRLDKGFRLVCMNSVQQQDERYFTVTSEGGKRTYTVDTAEKTCDCPFFKNNEEVCCHMFGARLFTRSKELTASEIEQDVNGNHAANDHDNMEHTSMQTCTESNYSVNFRTTYRGIENVQFTVRGSNQAEIIERLNTVIDGLQVSVSHTAETNGEDVKHCGEHDAIMTRKVSKKSGKPYYSHVIDGKHCFGHA